MISVQRSKHLVRRVQILMTLIRVWQVRGDAHPSIRAMQIHPHSPCTFALATAAAYVSNVSDTSCLNPLRSSLKEALLCCVPMSHPQSYNTAVLLHSRERRGKPDTTRTGMGAGRIRSFDRGDLSASRARAPCTCSTTRWTIW